MLGLPVAVPEGTARFVQCAKECGVNFQGAVVVLFFVFVSEKMFHAHSIPLF